MYEVRYTPIIKKELEVYKRKGKDMSKFFDIVDKLRKGEKLPAKNKDYQLRNSKHFKGCRECHIEPDWLLIYQIYKNELILKLIETGSHSELF